MEKPFLEHSRGSIFYGAAEYAESLAAKIEIHKEIETLTNLSPDLPLSVTTSETTDILSRKTGKREFPTPKKPDPMPIELAFLFERITPTQMLYMWNFYTCLFICQCLSVFVYFLFLKFDVVSWGLATSAFSLVFMSLMIQNVYILHDVLHGATFPPYAFQKFITHCWADFFSLPWEDLILEHQRHHASTVDLLVHGEFGWDPAGWLYVLQEWTDKWYGWLTVPFVPLWHFLGANDTGALFAILWFSRFPDATSGGKCNKEFYKRWLPKRLGHTFFVGGLWSCVWFLGTWPLDRPLDQGWRFMMVVALSARVGFTIAWVVFTNLNHSHWWNAFLAECPDRKYPLLQWIFAFILGGRHRFNEMLFHDVHHAFPNAVGALSQRGRFHGWKKVHDAALDVLSRGLFLPQDEKPPMQKIQERRSFVSSRL